MLDGRIGIHLEGSKVDANHAKAHFLKKKIVPSETTRIFPRHLLKTTQTLQFDIENLLEMCSPQTIRVKRIQVWQNLLQEPSAMVASPRLRRPKPPSSLLETRHRKLLASGMEATWDEWTNI